METVEVVRKQKAKLLAASKNPLPVKAGADLFEQFLLRSLRGPSAGDTSGGVLSFDQTLAHLLENHQVFASRARLARNTIAATGARYIEHESVVLTAGGSRVVTSILLYAEADTTRHFKAHFKVIYVKDGSPRTDASIAALRAAGIKVETINPGAVSHTLANNRQITLVLVGTEVVLKNGGIISRMGTAQLAFLAKHMKGSDKRFLVAAETHKIVNQGLPMGPVVKDLDIRQKDIGDWQTLGRDLSDTQELLAEGEWVDYTPPNLIDGIITEQGVKQPTNIWAMLEDYI